MIKNYYLSFLIFCCALPFGYGQSDIIISQYIETNSGTTPKGIEIFNVSGTAITFSATNNLQVYQGTNGGACGAIGTINITSGTLGIDEVWVIGTANLTSFATTNGTDLGGTFIHNFSFNGDDALELYLGGVIQDAFGTCGSDPGSAWVGSGVRTNNNNLQIKDGICDGDIDGWTDPSVRFDQIPNSSTPTTMIGFGNAPASCNPTNTLVEFTLTNSTLTEDGLFTDICVEITNPSATVITEVVLGLDAGSSTATNGTDYDDGAGIPAAITFPQTLTFPANSSANQCITIFISNDDLLIEGDETIVLNLSSPSGGDAATLGSNTQHVLTILDNDAPAFADVVITEIMYNSAGTDDEWIEICNVSGSAQVLNSYTIEVGGTTEFTFPSTGVVLADGDCITIALGEDLDNPLFNPDCDFTPDYTNGAGTGTLNNTSDIISLIASDGSTVVDEVTYDVGDGGNETSLHVIDTSLDNSDTGINFWEVLNGGSPGINSLISPCTPIGPEINLEGTTANFPNIANNDVTPAGFDGTDFGGVTIGGTSTNTFRIENFGGTENLTITSVTVFSGDISDFTISSLPSSPIAALNFSLFDVEFSPTAIGIRSVIIEIRSNDSDEDPYRFAVRGTGLCVANAITAEPSSGPVGTIVRVSGTNLSTATASFNGLAAIVNNISPTEMEVTVPSGASSGNLEITDDLGCPGATPFTVIESLISSCEGSSGTTPTDLFISEVTDASTGGLTYIEIYNGTGSTVNLANYSVQFFNNGNATENGGIISLNNVNLTSGNTYVLSVSTGSTCTGITGADGSLADQSGFGGINFVVNGDDHIRLYDGTTHIDSWGTYLSATWADPLGIGSEGVIFTRNNNAGTLPNTIFNLADWIYVDWVACSDNDYANIGTYDFSSGTPPTVNSISSATTACNEVTISVAATEGFTGGSNSLAYQWYYFDPDDATLPEWKPITDSGIYSNSSTANLLISDANSVLDNQFYCEVREDDASCSTASDAIKINISTATWSGSWSSAPTSAKTVILNSNYDTFTQTNFSACNLIINDNVLLNIADLTYIEVINSLTVNGTNAEINIEPQGSFVQVNDTGSVSATVPTNLTVNKRTAPALTANEYTYWSSPVVGETIGGALFLSNSNRRYWFNAQNFRDSNAETAGNLNVFVPGQDDIDDDGDDWQQITLSSTTMQPGVGYASTHNPALFACAPGPPSCPDPRPGVRYEFKGLFNNGEILVPIYRDDAERNDNNWNLIGNPYPSAIAINGPNGFLTQNTAVINGTVTGGAIDGAIFIWSQSSAPLTSTNGNENINFSQSDYAIVNGSGGVAEGGDTNGDGTIDNADRPSEFIPSGQSFFIAMSDTSPAYGGSPTIKTTDVVFNNAMRTTGNNDQFFRTSDDTSTDSENKLWLTLKTDNGVFNEILITYLDNATDADDGMYYDAPRNASTAVNSVLYTFIPNVDKKFAIQGKNSRSLSTDEIIPVGFYNAIAVPTIFTISISTLEGEFLTNQPVFIKDNLLNRLHNLKGSDYTFTSDTGEFNQRFEIVFRADALSIDDNQIDANALTIVELENGDVQFKVGKQLNITNVKLLDMTGRQIYNLKGNTSTEVYTLSQLSKAPYIAKVTLSNGQVINKKAIKQR